MTTLRCLSCGRERPRNAPVCEACERRLREAAELRKLGVVVLKDHVSDEFQIKIGRDTSREFSAWSEQVGGIVRKFTPIRELEIGGDGDFVEDLLACVEGSSALLSLQLSMTQLTDGGVERIRTFPSLEMLDLSRTRITDAGLVHLSSLTRLSRLSVCGTRITADGLAHLQCLPRLQLLDLSWTDVDDTAFMKLAHMPALRRLDIKGTRMTHPAVKAFSSQHPDMAVNWAPTLKLIGYWSADDHAAKRAYAGALREPIEDLGNPAMDEDSDEDSPFIHPRRLVDSSWAREDRSRVAQYLSGARALAHAGGHSYCRFGCGLTGCAELSDGVWLWPEGLSHYVEHHDDRLPDEFLDHVRARGYSPSPPEGIPIDFGCQSVRFWRDWCAAQKKRCRG